MTKDIFGTRPYLTPYDFPKYAEIHKKILQSPWSPYEVSFDADINFWDNRATETEKRLITNLFKAFTLAENEVGCYWRGVVAESFFLPEIVNVATAASFQETNHAVAYNHLETTLGLDSTEDFFNDPTANEKLEYLVNFPKKSKGNIKDLLVSLAVFSGAVEGVSLFSSFAVLLNFARSGKLTSSYQILSWSTLDEEMHSAIGINLFRDVIEQYPGERPSKEEILEGFDIVVKNEERFLKNAFNGEKLENINESIALDFLYHRANMKLKELGYPAYYEENGNSKDLRDFFYTVVLGDADNDFFALSRNGSGYSAMIAQDFTRPDLEKYKKLLEV